MSIEAIAFACFIVLSIVVIGYLFTAVEFKHMSDNPEEFGMNDDMDEIHISSSGKNQ